MNSYGSAVESADNRNLCSGCYRETGNAELCDKCILDSNDEILEVGGEVEEEEI